MPSNQTTGRPLWIRSVGIASLRSISPVAGAAGAALSTDGAGAPRRRSLRLAMMRIPSQRHDVVRDVLGRDHPAVGAEAL